MSEQVFDVVVVGGGPTGQTAAARVVGHGLSAVVVERELYGGECHYWGCIPSKALLRPVHAAAAAARLPGVPTGALNTAAVLVRRDRFVNNYVDVPDAAGLNDGGVATARGAARVAGERRVVVTGADGAETALVARHAVVLAGGSDAVVPDVPGLLGISPWTNREVTAMKTVPRRLLVIGGGAVAVEMATAVKGLGAEHVTMLVRGERLLKGMESFAGDLLLTALREAGVDVRLQTEATSFVRDGRDVTAQLTGGHSVTADEVLVASGRRARTEGLGLDTVGLGNGFVKVDESMRVPGSQWLYACGDINGLALLTHMGKYQARVAGDVIAARAKGEPDGRDSMRATAATPQVIFTDPQVCSVGMTESQARTAGMDVQVVSVDISSVPGAALLADGYIGKAALVLDAARSIVVGATFVGYDVAELLHSATVAVTAKVPLDVLVHAVPSFPTVSEIWNDLLAQAGV